MYVGAPNLHVCNYNVIDLQNHENPIIRVE